MATSPSHRARAQDRILIFSTEPADRYRAGRTVRALRGTTATVEEVCGPARLAEALKMSEGAVWLIRAGAWPTQTAAARLPPPSVTGQALCALGLIRPEAGSPAAGCSAQAQWAALQAETGGDFALVPDLAERLPPIASVYFEAGPAAELGHRLAHGEELPAALRAVLGSRHRVVHYPPLDVYHDPALRVVQIVTTLQRGGAERVVLDLTQGLGKHGVRCLLVTLGRPTRAPFPVPPGTIDLSTLRNGLARIEAAASVARSFAADLVHGHLLSVENTIRLSARGLPVLLTVHNTLPGWPHGLESLRAADAALLVACSRAVEADLRAARIPVPARTVWNGIDFAPYGHTPALEQSARVFRRSLQFTSEDFVLLALANPRPQKRLERLPAILAATQAELGRCGIRRTARLVIAGEASPGSETAVQSEALLRAEITRHGVREHVRLLGTVGEVASLLRACDVLVATSAYEGLSLAHLEALATGLPVVATNAGGTAEIAQANPAVFIVPLDTGPDHFATVLAALAQRPPGGGREAAQSHFTRWRMAERYAQLYPRAVEAARGQRRGSGLLLVSNNFATGGAQSSGRRLLLGLAAESIRVRAAVLEEQPAYPTPGRCALTAAGIPVLALPPAGTIDPAEAVDLLLQFLDADPPEAVLLWNAITEYKVLLADRLLDIPLYDVSPGEMYFTSLEHYFSRPRPGLPYRGSQEYGARLAGVIVKYQAEAERAARVLGTRVHVIPNGIPLSAWRSRSSRPMGERLVMGTLARLSPQKKLEQLLTALRHAQGRLPPHVLRIAGGTERGGAAYALDLRRLACGLPVEWVGELENPRPFLRALDIFAMVSEPAGCPNALMEAMAEGLPVAATDAGGAAEQVQNGVTGRLVARGDVGALAEALVELAQDPVRRMQWGIAGRARVEAHFAQERMVSDYRRVCLGSAPEQVSG